jgi:hypothetical protein
MCKYLLLLALKLVSLSQAYSQKARDTILIHKNINDSNYHVVFIESPQSVYHKKVIESIIFDSVTINKKLRIFDSLGFIKNKKINSIYCGNWISAFIYKGRKYAYYPSEPYYNLYLRVTDSTLILNDFNDGLSIYSIKALKKFDNECTYKIVNSSLEEFTISFVVKKGGISLKSSLFNRRNIQIVNQNNYSELPIIVNFCPSERCEEFNFN